MSFDGAVPRELDAPRVADGAPQDEFAVYEQERAGTFGQANHDRRAFSAAFEPARLEAHELDRRRPRVDTHGVGDEDRSIGLREIEAQAVRPVGNDFSPVVSSVPAEDSAPGRVTLARGERAHRIAVIVDDDGVDRVRIPQPHRETRGRLRAAAGRREHRLETGPRDRRLLELERLGQGECRRCPRKEGEQQHRNREARQASAILCFALAPEVVQYR